MNHSAALRLKFVSHVALALFGRGAFSILCEALLNLSLVHSQGRSTTRWLKETSNIARSDSAFVLSDTLCGFLGHQIH